MQLAMAISVGLIVSLFLGACSSTGPTPTPVDPWVKAVQDAQALMAGTNLQKHVAFYQRQFSEMDQYLAAVENVRPALNTLARLKTMDLPLVGNAWDLLIKGLDASAPGAGQALVKLDKELRRLLTYRGHLKSLQNLNALVEAANRFSQTPSPQTLRALDAEAQSALPILQRAQSDIAEIRDTVSDVTDAIFLVEQGVNGLSGAVSRHLAVRDALYGLNDALEGAAQPLRELNTELGTWQSYLGEDIGTLQRLHKIVYNAENYVPPKPAHTVPLLQWLPIALVGLLAVLVIGAAILLTLPKNRAPMPPLPPARSPSQEAIQGSPMGDEKPPPVPERSSAPLAVGSIVRPARLRVIGGPQAGEVFIVTRDNVLVGRSASSSIRIMDPYVSRQHCRLRYAQGTWFVQDMNSRSGTFVNERRVSATALRKGDIIRVGQTQLLFEA